MIAARDAISAGHLDTLVAYNIAGIEDPDSAGDNHGANDALQSLLMTIDRDRYLGVLSHHGFALGLRFALLVATEPLADHRDTMQTLIDAAIAEYRVSEAT